LRADQLLGPADQAGGKTHTAGDFKGVAGAGDAGAEMVGRLEGFDIEGHGAVLHPFCAIGESLECALVGGDQGEGMAGGELFQDGHGQRRALFGVGSGADLVNEHKAAGSGGFGDGLESGQMGGKGGEIVIDRLLVADAGVNRADGTDARMGQSRDMQPAAGHQGEQTHRFEGHRFAAGIGAADDDRVIIFPERDFKRDDLFFSHAQHQQGMTAAGNVEERFRGEFRRMGIEPARKDPLGIEEVELGEKFKIGLEERQRLAQQVGEMAQDPFHLPGFIGLEFADAVVVLHRLDRFDKNTRPARGLVEHQSPHLALVLLLDHQDQPAVAHGDQILLEHALSRQGAQHRLHALAGVVLRPRQQLAYRRQFRGGLVLDSEGILIDAAADLFLDGFPGLEPAGDTFKVGHLLPARGKIEPEPTDRPEGVQHRNEFFRGEVAAADAQAPDMGL